MWLRSLGFGQKWWSSNSFVISNFLLILLIKTVFILVAENFDIKLVKFDFGKFDLVLRIVLIAVQLCPVLSTKFPKL